MNYDSSNIETTQNIDKYINIELCNSSSEEQEWILRDNNMLETKQMFDMTKEPLCATITGYTSGAYITLQSCDVNNKKQKWNFIESIDKSRWRIKSICSLLLVVDVFDVLLKLLEGLTLA